MAEGAAEAAEVVEAAEAAVVEAAEGAEAGNGWLVFVKKTYFGKGNCISTDVRVRGGGGGVGGVSHYCHKFTL